MSPINRELTPAEAGVVNLLLMFDDACNTRKLTVTVTGSKAAAEVVLDLQVNKKILKALKVDYVRAKGKYQVTFSLSDFDKYIRYLVYSCGMTLLTDGTLITYDQLTITNDYLPKDR